MNTLPSNCEDCFCNKQNCLQTSCKYHWGSSVVKEPKIMPKIKNKQYHVCCCRNLCTILISVAYVAGGLISWEWYWGPPFDPTSSWERSPSSHPLFEPLIVWCVSGDLLWLVMFEKNPHWCCCGSEFIVGCCIGDCWICCCCCTLPLSGWFVRCCNIPFSLLCSQASSLSSLSTLWNCSTASILSATWFPPGCLKLSLDVS